MTNHLNQRNTTMEKLLTSLEGEGCGVTLRYLYFMGPGARWACQVTQQGGGINLETEQSGATPLEAVTNAHTAFTSAVTKGIPKFAGALLEHGS